MPPSSVSGVPQTGRLTNLNQLSVDTSWWTRYRSKENPDLGATFPQAIPSLNQGQHPAIPTSAADLSNSNHIQAIANTAGVYFWFFLRAGTTAFSPLWHRGFQPKKVCITL